MPTKAELDELLNNCTWTWTTQNGVNGYKVTGPNGNSIFLPITGVMYGGNLRHDVSGFYWSSSLDTGGESNYAYYMTFNMTFNACAHNNRDSGQCVRPVCQ